MKPEIHKMKVEKYGSFLFCPEKKTLCFGTDTEDGSCKHKSCLLDDPAYLKKQAEIEKRIAVNARREQERRKTEKHDPPAPIRRQRKSAADMIREQIKNKERFAHTLYKENKPKKGDAVMHEVMILQSKLRRVEK